MDEKKFSRIDHDDSQHRVNRAEPAAFASETSANKRSRDLNYSGEHEAMLGRVMAGKYRLTRYIGAGGMGTIFEGFDLVLNRAVAVKLLRPTMTQDAKSVQRFQQEGKAASRLNHANIVAVYDFGMHNEVQPYLVMEYVVGESLSQILDRETRLPFTRALQIVQQICEGLEHAHQHKVVHRDLKPANILITPRGNLELVKIVDFGIAKIACEEGVQNLTSTGEIFGSPLYMSPEQSLGFSLDGRSDIYSLGCMLYECLTGSPPHVADSPLVTIAKHQQEEPLSLREASMGVDFHEDLERIVAKMLAKQSIDRYASAAALNFEISNFLEGNEYQSAPREEGVSPADQFKRAAAATSFRHFQNIKVAAENVDHDPNQAKLMVGAVCLITVLIMGVIIWVWKEFSAPVNAPPQTSSSYRHAMSLDESRECEIGGPQWQVLITFPAFYTMEQLNCTEHNLLHNEWSVLAKMSKLKDLELMSSTFSDADMEYICELPLQYLGLEKTVVSDSGLHVLSAMKTLRVLDISNMRSITDQALGELPNTLIELQCAGDHISGANLQPLINMKELRSLSLEGTLRTSEDLQAVTTKAVMAKATIAKAVKVLCCLKNLQFLDVRNTSLTQADINQLAVALPNCVIRSNPNYYAYADWLRDHPPGH